MKLSGSCKCVDPWPSVAARGISHCTEIHVSRLGHVAGVFRPPRTLLHAACNVLVLLFCIFYVNEFLPFFVLFLLHHNGKYLVKYYFGGLWGILIFSHFYKEIDFEIVKTLKIGFFPY